MPQGDYWPNSWPVVPDQAAFDQFSSEFNSTGAWNDEVTVFAGERLAEMRAANPELTAAHDRAVARQSGHIGHLAAKM